MQYTEKEISQIILEIAQKIYIGGINADFKKGNYLDEYERHHLANYSIEVAREFVEVASRKGLINAIQLPMEFRP